MRSNARWRGLFVLLTALTLALFVAACGDDNDDSSDSGGSSSANAIKSNAENNGKKITVGSKNFDEQFILGEIYAQALTAAGYDVSTDLNLGDENIALKAVESGAVTGYPEYTATALTSFFKEKPEDVPADAKEAADAAAGDFAAKGLVAFEPAPFNSANAVGMLKSKAEELGVTKISDLEGKSQDLTLYGTTECRQRIDCLLGLQQEYGLQFGSFKPTDSSNRYTVLDNGDADLSIVYTSDGELANSDKYVILEDDKGLIPAGNPIFITTVKDNESLGPDFKSTIEEVQKGLTPEAMQELNARVSIDKEQPKDVAADYLKETGYVE